LTPVNDPHSDFRVYGIMEWQPQDSVVYGRGACVNWFSRLRGPASAADLRAASRRRPNFHRSVIVELQSSVFWGRSALCLVMRTGNGMNEPKVNQAAPLHDDMSAIMVQLEMSLLERCREIDKLKLDVARYRKLSEDAQGRAAMLQAAFDRHFAHCGKDDAAIQRLMAGQSHVSAQAAIIERRNSRIASLQQEVDRLKGKASPNTFGFGSVILRLKKALYPR
jgi:hypothetical protein